MSQSNYSDSFGNQTTASGELFLKIGNLLANYFLPAVGVISLVENIFFCFILRELVQNRFYALLFSKQFLEILLSLLAILR